ncbi:hypothetical protein [Oricola sp.]|nr:hypothetical protein [Oricola sp.]
MAKGQKRGNREIRKPKQPKEAVLASGSTTPIETVTPSGRKK